MMKNPRLLSCVAVALSSSWASAQTTLRVNLAPSGEPNGRSENPECSADGRFVVWQTLADNMVAGDTNGTWDVFLHDRQTGVTELVSKTPGDVPGSGPSVEPSISDNGRYIAFRSNATNIIAGKDAGVFVYDRVLQTFAFATKSSVYTSSTSLNPSLSRDGRFVVYSSNRKLTAEDTNAKDDIYRYDRVTDSVELVSRDLTGVQSPSDCKTPTVTADGRFVVFETTSTTWGAPYASNPHIWRKDLQTGVLDCISTSSLGLPANGLCRDPAISTDGKWVTFTTVASNLVVVNGALQIAAKNLVTGAVEQVTVNDAGQPANNYSYEPEISPDGRFVNYRSAASNFHMGGTNAYFSLFVRDLRLQTTRKVSLDALGGSNDEDCDVGEVSLSGRFAVFSSISTSLVAGDSNGFEDIFVHDRQGTATYTYGWNPAQSIGCTPFITTVGTPSVSQGSGFDIKLANTRGAVPGILIYSKSGPAVIPAFGANLYVASPTVRSSVLLSGGSAGQCNGEFSFDFNLHVAGGSDPGLTNGTPVWAQYWSRDVGSTSGSHLSDAVAFVLGA